MRISESPEHIKDEVVGIENTYHLFDNTDAICYANDVCDGSEQPGKLWYILADCLYRGKEVGIMILYLPGISVSKGMLDFAAAQGDYLTKVNLVDATEAEIAEARDKLYNALSEYINANSVLDEVRVRGYDINKATKREIVKIMGDRTKFSQYIENYCN